MTPRDVGFVILSHSHPQQLLRLVHSLQQVYDDPPISIHHNFGLSPANRSDFPSGVRFVTPHLKTGWGKFAVVEAALRALDLLYRDARPQWFFLLSGLDYPIAPASTVITELVSNGVDALLDYREIPLRGPLPCCERSVNPALKYFASPSNLALAWRRYVGVNIGVPVIRKGPRLGRLTLYPPVRDWRAPFGPSFKCLFGDHWFAGNAKVANILSSPTPEHLDLRRHLRRRIVPEECYYQTVLGNHADLRISKATRRFSDWMSGGAHPKTLELSDMSSIFQSKDYFARKVAPHSALLDQIDSALQITTLKM
jgi:hypothetical protein